MNYRYLPSLRNAISLDFFGLIGELGCHDGEVKEVLGDNSVLFGPPGDCKRTLVGFSDEQIQARIEPANERVSVRWVCGIINIISHESRGETNLIDISKKQAN